MMNIRVLSLATILLMLMWACGSDAGKNSKRRQSNLLPPMKIEIPSEIKDDAELVDLIKKSEAAINEFSDNLEVMVEDMMPMIEKTDEGEELGTFDKLKVGKIMLEFAQHSTETMETMELLNAYTESKEAAGELLNDDQLRALATVHDAFNKRMEDLNNKFEEMSNKLND